MTNKIHEIPLCNVRVTNAFWSSRQHLIADVTVPYMGKILRDEGYAFGSDEDTL